MEMELEEAIKHCEIFIKCMRTDLKEECKDNFILAEAIETVLQALEKSIPKKRIEDKIKELKTYLKYAVKYANTTEQTCTSIELNVLQQLLEDK